MRGFLRISQNELPKRAFRAMPLTIFTEEGSKMIVSCEASSKFHKRRFQTKRCVRGFLQFCQKKLPKRTLRATLLQNFTQEASKRIVSCEASSNFHKRRFQNECFAPGFLKFSQNNASKTSVSRHAFDSFHRRRFQNDRFVRGFIEISQKKVPKQTDERVVSRRCQPNPPGVKRRKKL